MFKNPRLVTDHVLDWLRAQSELPASPPPSYYRWARIGAIVSLTAAVLIVSLFLWVMTTQTAWYYGGPETKTAAAQAAGGWRATGVLVTRARFALLLVEHGLLISFLAWVALTGRGVRFGDRLSKWIKARPSVSGWRAKLPARFRDRFRLLVVYVISASLVYGVYAFAFELLLYGLKLFFNITHEDFASLAIRNLLEVAVTVTYVWGAGLVFYSLVGLFPRHWLWLSVVAMSALVFGALLVTPDFKHLYNHTTPLADKRKEALILEFAKGAGTEADLEQIDSSRQSEAINAKSTGYLPGLPAKPHVHIVYTDTLLYGFTDAEILFATGHELGHHALGVNAEAKSMRLIVMICLVPVAIFAAGRACKFLVARYPSRLGYGDMYDPASVPLVALMAGILAFAHIPVDNAMMLYQERYADWAAAWLLVRDGPSREAGVNVFEKLGTGTPSDPHPPLVIQLFLDHHPAADERIRFVKSFDGATAGERPPRHSWLEFMFPATQSHARSLTEADHAAAGR
jgi:STE24 endopeptidase